MLPVSFSADSYAALWLVFLSGVALGTFGLVNISIIICDLPWNFDLIWIDLIFGISSLLNSTFVAHRG